MKDKYKIKLLNFIPYIINIISLALIFYWSVNNYNNNSLWHWQIVGLLLFSILIFMLVVIFVEKIKEKPCNHR